jgi:hypothetical protein
VRPTKFVHVPSPSLEIPYCAWQIVGVNVFLELSTEKVVAVHEIVSWLRTILWSADKKRGDLIDTHDCDLIESYR